ncbi:hypothetical protein MNV49_004085 [Pseudohyphozyma bogoriensis]|nr:hypothetical protein MNV49_004085 [Pseudohyphozyma bogoriensis]
MIATAIKETQYVTYDSMQALTTENAVRVAWTDTFETIPVISFKNIFGTLEERKEIAKELERACREVGFYYAKDTPGITPELIAETFATMQQFFDIPKDDKMEACWSKSPACRGYEPFDESSQAANTVSNLRESFCIGDDYLDAEQNFTGTIKAGILNQNLWPNAFPSLRTQLYKYYAAVEPFGRALLEIYALALGLDENAFEKEYSFPIWGMRALHYPPQPPEEESLGLGAHTDATSFTLVCQEPGSGPALEVLNLNGHWISAPPISGAAFTCNTGDFFEVLSNGRFVSTVHRVCNKTGLRRYSLPYFLAPEPDVVIKPVVEKGEEEGRFEEINVGEHYVTRILSGRTFHPSSKLLREKRVPKEEWKYEWMQGLLPAF